MKLMQYWTRKKTKLATIRFSPLVSWKLNNLRIYTMYYEQLRESIIETAYCTFAIRLGKKKKTEKTITIMFYCGCNNVTSTRNVRDFLSLVTLVNVWSLRAFFQTGFAPIVRKRSRTFSGIIRLRILRTAIRAASLHPEDSRWALLATVVDVVVITVRQSTRILRCFIQLHAARTNNVSFFFFFFFFSSNRYEEESHAGISFFPLRDIHRGNTS